MLDELPSQSGHTDLLGINRLWGSAGGAVGSQRLQELTGTPLATKGDGQGLELVL